MKPLIYYTLFSVSLLLNAPYPARAQRYLDVPFPAREGLVRTTPYLSYWSQLWNTNTSAGGAVALLLSDTNAVQQLSSIMSVVANTNTAWNFGQPGNLIPNIYSANVYASQITGPATNQFALANPTVVTNTQTGVSLSGTFSGNAAGLTNLPAASLTGLLSASLLPISTNGFVDARITNGLAAISYVNAATNGFIGPNVTNGLASIPYVQAATNGLATTAYVQASTNGFTGPGVTNGLASQAYVNQATNGFVGPGITNGLSTIPYVTAAINTATNGLSSTNGLATTNYVNLQLQNATNGLAAVPYVNTATNGLVGPHITNGLATIQFVQASTNGFTGPGVTNGLATIGYVNAATNGLGGGGNVVSNTSVLFSTVGSTNYAPTATNNFAGNLNVGRTVSAFYGNIQNLSAGQINAGSVNAGASIIANTAGWPAGNLGDQWSQYGGSNADDSIYWDDFYGAGHTLQLSNNLFVVTGMLKAGAITESAGLAGTNASEFSLNPNGDGVVGGVQMTNGNISAQNLIAPFNSVYTVPGSLVVTGSVSALNLILAPGGMLNPTNLPLNIYANTLTFTNGLTGVTNATPPANTTNIRVWINFTNTAGVLFKLPGYQ